MLSLPLRWENILHFRHAGRHRWGLRHRLEDYFSPKKNVDYEIFQFRQTTQPTQHTFLYNLPWIWEGLATQTRTTPCTRTEVRKCGKPNHVAKICLIPINGKKDSSKRQPIKAVLPDHNSSSSDDECLYTTGKDRSKIPIVKVEINNVKIKMIMDTRASTYIF